MPIFGAAWPFEAAAQIKGPALQNRKEGGAEGGRHRDGGWQRSHSMHPVLQRDVAEYFSAEMFLGHRGVGLTPL
jgi:hypothetical protein